MARWPVLAIYMLLLAFVAACGGPPPTRQAAATDQAHVPTEQPTVTPLSEPTVVPVDRWCRELGYDEVHVRACWLEKGDRINFGQLSPKGQFRLRGDCVTYSADMNDPFPFQSGDLTQVYATMNTRGNLTGIDLVGLIGRVDLVIGSLQNPVLYSGRDLHGEDLLRLADGIVAWECDE